MHTALQGPLGRTYGALVAITLVLTTTPVHAQSRSLYDTLEALDTAVFDAFNHCQQPEQLAKHASYFDPAVEFYHDTGGVTWTRQAMLANTQANACGRYTRQRVSGSLQVYEIAGFGALAEGQHRFCAAGSEHCEGTARFTMLWRHHNGQWQITRVISYGHRATTADDQP